MCGRYSWFHADDLLAERFDVALPDFEIPKTYNATPGMTLPIITEEQPDVPTLARWGFVPRWMPQGAKQVINARAETLSIKPYFRDAMKTCRCLVLADGFYEWQRTGKTKAPYRIQRKDGQPFTFAGLYDKRSVGKATQPCFTIITTEANRSVAPIHHRMPVMMLQEDERRWLDSTLPVAKASLLLQQYPDDLLTAYPISKKINRAIIDDPSLIEKAV